MIWFPGRHLSNGVASNTLSDAGDNTHELWFDWLKQREAKLGMSRLLTKAEETTYQWVSLGSRRVDSN